MTAVTPQELIPDMGVAPSRHGRKLMETLPRSARLADMLIRHVDTEDRVDRQLLREAYRLRREDPQVGGSKSGIRLTDGLANHRKGDEAQLRTRLRDSRWRTKTSHNTSDRLSDDLSAMERTGAIRREGSNVVRIVDWVTLGRIQRCELVLSRGEWVAGRCVS